jgi:uncharacterized protein YabN with tetrapyrrole methylase and pyrophosphatase domain
MKKIIEFNYQSTVNRGLINEDTTIDEFINKIKEEESEMIDESYNVESDLFANELADLIMVCFNIARHYKIDIERHILNNILKNMKR